MSAFPAAARVLEDAVAARVFPGAILEIGTSAGVVATLAVGAQAYEAGSPRVDDTTIYDLASLTKVIATSALAAGLVERGAVGLEDYVARWAPAWSGTERRAASLRHLLEHTSGLPAHRPYFRTLEGRDAFEAAICAEPLEYVPGARSVYSDAGFILFGIILERIAGRTLDMQFDAWRAAHLPADLPLQYHPPSEWQPRIAPTEQDPWRGRLLRGEVHDENAAALGGVAAHAGLFGTAAAVGACARWWLARAAQSSVVAEFTRRGRVPGSSRALGWDTMLRTSSCGTRMSPTAFGHTGFTGTSLWIDPAVDRYVVLLSNRVHPSRAGEAMTRVRPAVHDAVWADLAHV